MQKKHPKFRRSPHSFSNKAKRQAWWLVYTLLFRLSPRLMYSWRSFLLKLFGAQIEADCKIYPSVKVWAPWNLRIGREVAIGEFVDLYSVDIIEIGDFATISQGTVLCTATHDISSLTLPLVTGPITVGENAWLCAESYIMPNISIGAGSVIGVRSTVLNSVAPWKIAAGIPCRELRDRELEN
jgi:putative colanic acid biosynthesis acetyltransferase WcaF